MEEVEPIHSVVGEEARHQPPTALAHQAGDVSSGQGAEQPLQVQSTRTLPQWKYLCRSSEALPQAVAGLAPRYNEHGSRALKDGSIRGHVSPGVQQDAKRRPERPDGAPDGQLGVVGFPCARAHHDRIESRPEAVDFIPRLGACQPVPSTTRRRQSAVDGEGEFHGHERPVRPPVEKGRVLGSPLVRRPEGPLHPDPPTPQPVSSAPLFGPRLSCPVDHASHTGFHQGISAGRRLPLMPTRLEAHIGRGTPGQRASPFERQGLGMGAAKPLMNPFAHDLPVPDQYASHQGIWMDSTPSPAAQSDRMGQIPPIRRRQPVPPVGGRETEVRPR